MAASTIMTLNDDGMVMSGFLWCRVGKAKVLDGGVFHLHVRQYGVASYCVGVTRLVDLKEEQWALSLIKLGNLAKTDIGAAVAGSPGKQDRHPKAHKTLSLLGVDCCF